MAIGASRGLGDSHILQRDAGGGSVAHTARCGFLLFFLTLVSFLAFQSVFIVKLLHAVKAFCRVCSAHRSV